MCANWLVDNLSTSSLNRLISGHCCGEESAVVAVCSTFVVIIISLFSLFFDVNNIVGIVVGGLVGDEKTGVGVDEISVVDSLFCLSMMRSVVDVSSY